MASQMWTLLRAILVAMSATTALAVQPVKRDAQTLGSSHQTVQSASALSTWRNRTASTFGATAAVWSPSAQSSSEASHTKTNANTVLNGTVGGGFHSDEVCLSMLQEYKTSSTVWDFAHTAWETLSFPAQAFSYVQASVPRYHATSVTTLCDGHPRVVGDATSSNGPEMVSYMNPAYGGTVMQTGVPSYAVPAPSCTIASAACQSMYDADPSSVRFNWTPLCSYSIPTSSAPAELKSTSTSCQGCYIMAREARLLYWPIRTVEGSEDLCQGSATTTGGTPATTGASTVVTDGITITSPSVGISFAGLSRQDLCGTTYSDTILVVHPDQVSSVRGAHGSRGQMLPFEFQHLNYKCQTGNSSTYTIQDEPGASCYQDVPAAAYFSGVSANMWDSMYTDTQYASLTIGNDYHPYVAAPDALASYASQVWGAGCYMDQMGVWDPPLALKPTASLAPPSMGPGPTTTSFIPTSRSATPASTLAAHLSPTASPQAVDAAFGQEKTSANFAGSLSTSASRTVGKDGDTRTGTLTTETCDVACKVISVLATASSVHTGDGDPSISVLDIILGMIPGALEPDGDDVLSEPSNGITAEDLPSSDEAYTSRYNTKAPLVDLDSFPSSRHPTSLGDFAPLTTMPRGHTSLARATHSFTIGSRIYTLMPAQSDDTCIISAPDGIFNLRLGSVKTAGNGEVWSVATEGLVYRSAGLSTTLTVAMIESKGAPNTAFPSATITTMRAASGPSSEASGVKSFEIQHSTRPTASQTNPADDFPTQGYGDDRKASAATSLLPILPLAVLAFAIAAHFGVP